MNNEDNLFDALIEELKVERTFVPAKSPPYSGGFSGTDPQYWRHESYQFSGDKFDIAYLNKEGEYHRLSGPAYISHIYEYEIWYKDGEYHRDNGPALIQRNTKVWFKNGKLHNLAGPAIVSGGTPPKYFIDGRPYSPKEYKKEITRMRRKGLV
jgi:hypothetical protein